jgi:electron transfer flavoprotein alpha subunit
MKTDHIDSWSGILVYLECQHGSIHPAGLELIGAAWNLAHKLNTSVYGVAVGTNLDSVIKQIKDSPLETLYLYEEEDIYSPTVYERAVNKCIENLKPSIVLIGGTDEGRSLAPRLAVAFESGLTADCTSLDIDSMGNLVQIRPAFGGNVMASIITASSRPQFATVRRGVMEPFIGKSIIRTKVVKAKEKITDKSYEVLDIQEKKEKGGITDQNILVVAGRGVKKKADLAQLRELADLLGGKLASSRALVEKGWMDSSEQIGLSGNTVSPQYMITCGVSGTVQFMAGMKQTENIIAINHDPDARIFEIAHYPVCGDWYEIVPELLNRLRSREN